MLGEILGLDSEDLEKISLQRLRSIIAIINVWQAKMNSHGEKPTVGRLLEAGRKLNIEEKTIREAFYKPRGNCADEFHYLRIISRLKRIRIFILLYFDTRN